MEENKNHSIESNLNSPNVERKNVKEKVTKRKKSQVS